MSIIENKIMKKIKGFTLLEAVFAIAVTILCAQILFGLIGTLRKVNRQKTGVNEISYSYVQINNFLKENDNFELVPIDEVNVDLDNQEKGYLKIYPYIHGMDGFFIAELKRVTWSTKKELLKNTGIVLATIISFTILVWALDTLLSGALALIIK